MRIRSAWETAKEAESLVSLGLEARIGSGLVLEVETSARSWERVRVFVAISEVRVALRAWEARSVWRSVRRREWASWAGGVVVGGVVESGVGRVILEKSRSWGECQRTFGISEAHVFGDANSGVSCFGMPVSEVQKVYLVVC